VGVSVVFRLEDNEGNVGTPVEEEIVAGEVTVDNELNGGGAVLLLTPGEVAVLLRGLGVDVVPMLEDKGVVPVPLLSVDEVTVLFQ
jgi:hypothetical protein